MFGCALISSCVFSHTGEVSYMLESLLENHKAVHEGELELSHVRTEVKGCGLGLLVTAEKHCIVMCSSAVRDGWIIGGYVLVGSRKCIQ
jgi:hypothetical protein